MKILFIHNSVPEYRLEFWRILSGMVELQLLITDKDCERKAYGFQKDESGLKISYLTLSNYQQWLHDSCKFDVVVLSPVDNKKDYHLCKDFAKAAKTGNTKVVMWTEGWTWPKQPLHRIPFLWYERHIRKKICSMSDLCIVSGTRSYQYMRTLGAGELLMAIDSSTSPKSDLNNIRKKYGLPADSRIVLYLSRIMEMKGLDLLIEAFDKIASDYPNTYLLIGGDGSFKAECEALAATKASKDRIRFIGKIQPAVRASYFREADVFVLPTHESHGRIEIWGLVVNECLEQGTPVITTTAVGSSYDIVDDTVGQVVEENSVDSLMVGLQQVLDKPRGYFKDNCVARYDKYSIRHMANDFYQAFVKVTKK